MHKCGQLPEGGTGPLKRTSWPLFRIPSRNMHRFCFGLFHVTDSLYIAIFLPLDLYRLLLLSFIVYFINIFTIQIWSTHGLPPCFHTI